MSHAIDSARPGRTRPGPLRSLSANLRLNYELYLLIIPSLLYYVIFHYLPMYGVQIAFRDYIPVSGFWGSEWVGLANFQRFFNSFNAWPVIRNTLSISLMSLVLGFPFPILMALMINEIHHQQYQRTLQLVTYAPHFISTVSIVGMITIFLSERGLLNSLLALLGWPAVALLSSEGAFNWIYVLSGIWQEVGWGSIIYLSALSGIDTQLHEAAVIDGASKPQRIWHIDLPGILPTIVILLILRSGSIMTVGYEKVFLMQNPLNLATSEVISTYVYKIGLLSADYSYSAAVGLFNSVVNCLVLLLVNTFASKAGETSLW